MRLNFGCGIKKIEGYINVDIDPTVKPDVLSDTVDMAIFSECTVDEIYASHLIEHLSYIEFDKAIRSWRRILKHGGIIVLECPDFEGVCKEFLKADEEGKWVSYRKTWHSIIEHFYGNQKTLYQYHKNGFTRNRLKSILTSVGFRDIQFLEPAYKYCPCIKVKATKP